MVDFALLAAPFPEEMVQWRAQSVTKDGTKAMALAYIDARAVEDRLDLACGPANWQDSYVETPRGRIICTLGIRCGDEWIYKSDGAGNTDVEGDKGALSDALKRAAVKWGIGRYLYDMPTPWVPCESYKKGDKFQWKDWKESPWKLVRNASFRPAADETAALPPAIQTMLDEIEACDTQALLQRWWKDNNEKIPDAHYGRVLNAVNARREQITTMDMARAA
jgi:hypothetical protein